MDSIVHGEVKNNPLHMKRTALIKWANENNIFRWFFIMSTEAATKPSRSLYPTVFIYRVIIALRNLKLTSTCMVYWAFTSCEIAQGSPCWPSRVRLNYLPSNPYTASAVIWAQWRIVASVDFRTRLWKFRQHIRDISPWWHCMVLCVPELCTTCKAAACKKSNDYNCVRNHIGKWRAA
jgi:hypothetical protein